jgi:hypothetical protein
VHQHDAGAFKSCHHTLPGHNGARLATNEPPCIPGNDSWGCSHLNPAESKVREIFRIKFRRGVTTDEGPSCSRCGGTGPDGAVSMKMIASGGVGNTGTEEGSVGMGSTMATGKAGTRRCFQRKAVAEGEVGNRNEVWLCPPSTAPGSTRTAPRTTHPCPSVTARRSPQFTGLAWQEWTMTVDMIRSDINSR